MKKVSKQRSRGVILSPVKLKDDFLIELGNMVVTFSNLEKNLQDLCASQIKSRGKHYIGYIIVSEYSFRQLINVTRCIMVKKEYIDICGDVFQRLNNIEQERNKIIHSYYGTDIHDGSIVRNKNKNKPVGHVIDMIKISKEDVNKLITEMKETERVIWSIKSLITQKKIRIKTPSN